MPDDSAPRPLVSGGLAVAGGGLVVGAIGVTTFVLTSLNSSHLANASTAYAAEPTIENAQVVIDARAAAGPGSTTTALALAGACGGCLGTTGLVGGLVALLIGVSTDPAGPDAEAAR